MRALGVAMPDQTFRDPGVDATACVADVAVRGCIAKDRFERHALSYDIDAAGAVHVPVALVEDHQLVVGVVEREALGDAFDRVDQAASGRGDLAHVQFLDLDRRCAKHCECRGHPADLIAAAGWNAGLKIALGYRMHAAAERTYPRDDAAPHIEPDNQDGTEKAEKDG